MAEHVRSRVGRSSETRALVDAPSAVAGRTPRGLAEGALAGLFTGRPTRGVRAIRGRSAIAYRRAQGGVNDLQRDRETGLSEVGGRSRGTGAQLGAERLGYVTRTANVHDVDIEARLIIRIVYRQSRGEGWPIGANRAGNDARNSEFNHFHAPEK